MSDRYPREFHTDSPDALKRDLERLVDALRVRDRVADQSIFPTPLAVPSFLRESGDPSHVRSWSPISERALTPAPLASTWTLINFDATTFLTDQPEGLQLTRAGTVGTNNCRLAVRPVYGTPYRLRAMVRQQVSLGVAGTSMCGLCLRESSTGKFIRHATYWAAAASTQHMLVDKMTNPTTFSASYVDLTANGTGLFYLEIEDDGTTRSFRWSFDGVQYSTLTTNAHTDFITPDQIGLFVNPQTLNCSMMVCSWELFQ